MDEMNFELILAYLRKLVNSLKFAFERGTFKFLNISIIKMLKNMFLNISLGLR